MNDNTKLLKFAVENIKDWPERWTHLRSDKGEFCYFTLGSDWRKESDGCWSTEKYGLWECFKVFPLDEPQVVSKEEYMEALKGISKSEPENTNVFTKDMLKAGKHVVFAEYEMKYCCFIWLAEGLTFEINSFGIVPQNDINLEDIEKVYDIKFFSEDEDIEPIWSREDSKKEAKRKSLEEEIKQLERELINKKEELNKC